MTNRAIIRESDARRLAKIAKSCGVAVEVEIDGVKVTIRPEGEKTVDQVRKIVL